MSNDNFPPERAPTPTNLLDEWKEHSLRQAVRAATNLQATTATPTLYSPVGLPFQAIGSSGIAPQVTKSFLGGLDWSATSFSSSSTEPLHAANTGLLAESGVFAPIDVRKLSREALNTHWANLATTVRDAIYGDGDVPEDVHKELDEKFLPSVAHHLLNRALPAGGLFSPSNTMMRIKLIEAMVAQLDKLHAHEKTQAELRAWIQSMQDSLNHRGTSSSLIDFPSVKCDSQLQIDQLTDLLHRTSVVFRTTETSRDGEHEIRSVECLATIGVRPSSENTATLVRGLQRSKKRTAAGDVKDSEQEKFWALSEQRNSALTLSCILNSKESNKLSLKERQHFQVDLGEGADVQIFYHTFPDDSNADAPETLPHIQALKSRLLDGAPTNAEQAGLSDTQFLTFLTLVFCPDATHNLFDINING